MHRSLRIACALGALALLSGCFHPHIQHRGHARHGHGGGHGEVVVVREPGPPPHAPAHGHRHKLPRHGVELVFDSDLGVYVVVGWNDHFFYQGRFYRQVAAGWEVSARFGSGWAVARRPALPTRVVRRAHRRHHKKHRHHPAKHKY